MVGHELKAIMSTDGVFLGELFVPKRPKAPKGQVPQKVKIKLWGQGSAYV